jgi:PAS domain S-box-containing protein
MLTDFLQDRAALYATGEMTADDREQFEIIMQFHTELREFVAGLSDVGAAMAVAAIADKAVKPSAVLKERISRLLDHRPQQRTHEALVVSGADGLVQWVNPAFSEMCGYTLEELRGKKLGPILQGPETDRATAGRIREAVHANRACRETILNYHKDGTPYRVEIDLTPYFDDAGGTIWFVAREREVTERTAA